MIVGITGAHRGGKSTLARAYAEKHKLEYLASPVSSIFRELGYDPSITYDFTTRLDIQEEILKRLDKQYAEVRGIRMVVTDRTPIDMLAYTLGDVNGQTLRAADEPRLKQYIKNCFEVMNKRFSVLLVVQPGIPVLWEEGKASLSDGYIEHVASLVLGFSVDERMSVPHFYIPRHMLDPVERLTALEYAVNRTRIRALAERDDLTLQALH